MSEQPVGYRSRANINEPQQYEVVDHGFDASAANRPCDICGKNIHDVIAVRNGLASYECWSCNINRAKNPGDTSYDSREVLGAGRPPAPEPEASKLILPQGKGWKKGPR